MVSMGTEDTLSYGKKFQRHGGGHHLSPLEIDNLVFFSHHFIFFLPPLIQRTQIKCHSLSKGPLPPKAQSPSPKALSLQRPSPSKGPLPPKALSLQRPSPSKVPLQRPSPSKVPLQRPSPSKGPLPPKALSLQRLSPSKALSFQRPSPSKGPLPPKALSLQRPSPSKVPLQRPSPSKGQYGESGCLSDEIIATAFTVNTCS